MQPEIPESRLTANDRSFFTFVHVTTEDRHRGGRTLVVEDDPIVRSLMTRVLSARGIAVDAAADGEEAITLLERSDYAVILLDLMLPRVSGAEVLQRLAKREPRASGVVIVLSAAIETHADTLDHKVVHGFMRKPFDLDLLSGTVAAIVEGTRGDTHSARPDESAAESTSQ